MSTDKFYLSSKILTCKASSKEKNRRFSKQSRTVEPPESKTEALEAFLNLLHPNPKTLLPS